MKKLVSVLTLSLAMVFAPIANAQPKEDPDKFHWIKGQHVCIAFREQGVNIDTVIAIGESLGVFGFTESEKASVVAKSTEFWCPELMMPLWRVMYLHSNSQKSQVA